MAGLDSNSPAPKANIPGQLELQRGMKEGRTGQCANALVVIKDGYGLVMESGQGKSEVSTEGLLLKGPGGLCCA